MSLLILFPITHSLKASLLIQGRQEGAPWAPCPWGGSGDTIFFALQDYTFRSLETVISIQKLGCLRSYYHSHICHSQRTWSAACRNTRDRWRGQHTEYNHHRMFTQMGFSGQRIPNVFHLSLQGKKASVVSALNMEGKSWSDHICIYLRNNLPQVNYAFGAETCKQRNPSFKRHTV